VAHKHQIVARSPAARTGQHRHYRRREKAVLVRASGTHLPKRKKLRAKHAAPDNRKHLPADYVPDPLRLDTLGDFMPNL
jgi:hypothetical protein